MAWHGNCDNCGCNWDGGDCCGQKATFLYCKECSCKDPNFKGIVCSKPCEDASWKGDKTCDDENNHCGCGWDGGDCCGTTKDYDYLYCTECKCLDPKNQPKLKSGQICELHKKADSHCDPKNNHENCDFDGGDCCGGIKDAKAGRSKYHFCSAKDIIAKGAGKNGEGTGDCLCKDPRQQGKTNEKCSRACFVTKWAGDGNCDDQNNVCGCDWDGGDCCGTKRNFQYCTHCECRDPSYKS